MGLDMLFSLDGTLLTPEQLVTTEQLFAAPLECDALNAECRVDGTKTHFGVQRRQVCE